MNQDMKETIALNLITSRTIKEAAELSGCSISTVKRLKNKEDFQKYLVELKRRLMTRAMLKAEALSLDALQTLTDIMQDSKCTDSSRVAAARYILEMGMESHSMNEIEEQIKKLQAEVLLVKEGE